MKRVALVTGANRGLGYSTCEALAAQGYDVVLASRDVEKGRAAASKLGVRFCQLDVSDRGSIEKAAHYIKEEMGRLDVLINNAGIFSDKGGAFDASEDVLRKTLNTNVVGPFFLCQQMIPLMKANHYGRVVNLSSGLGQLTEMGSGNTAYRISKTALNAVTRIFSQEVHGTNILVNSVCPGWVRTDMGGASAPRSLEQGIAGILWAATLPDGGPTGGFFRDGKAIPW